MGDEAKVAKGILSKIIAIKFGQGTKYDKKFTK